MEKSRPFGGTILAILAAIAAILGIIRAIQFLGLLPFLNPLPFGPDKFWLANADWLGAILYVILALIWIWAARGLWNVDPQAWLFVVVLAVLYLILDVAAVLFSSTTSWGDVSLSILLSVIVLILALLPSTKQAYQT